MTGAKVRIISRLKGDGSVFVGGRRRTNYYVKFFSKNDSELERFRDDMKAVYGLEVKQSKKESGKKQGSFVKSFYVRSKLAFEDLQKYGPFGSYDWRIPEKIKNGSLDLQRESIRTFAEDEGTVISSRPEVRIYSVNERGLEDLKSMLLGFEIKSKIVPGYGSRRNVFGLIVRKSFIRKFRESIGFLSETKNHKLNESVERLNN